MPVLPAILQLALEYRSQPWLFRHLTDPGVPLPPGFDALVRDLGGALSAHRVAATAAALDSTAEELRAAVLLLLREALLIPSASYYRVLGVTQGADDELIANHYHVLMGLLHPDRCPPAERERDAADTVRINAAYSVLKDAALRRRYDQELGAHGSPVGSRSVLPRGWVAGPCVARSVWIAPAVRRAAVLAGAGALLCAMVVWSIKDNGPSLRMSDPGARRHAPPPSFLSSAPERAAPASAGVFVAARSGYGSGSGSGSGRPAAVPPAPTTESDTLVPGVTAPSALMRSDAESPALLLERFAQFIHAGDLTALLALMTDDARIVNTAAQGVRGSGDLFEGTVDRRLRLGALRLKPSDNSGFRADGRLERVPTTGAGGKKGGQAGTGRIALTIILDGSAYRISGVDYHIGSK